MKTRRSKRNGVRKTTYRSLSIIAEAWLQSERHSRDRAEHGTYGAAQGDLLSFWEFMPHHFDDLPY